MPSTAGTAGSALKSSGLGRCSKPFFLEGGCSGQSLIGQPLLQIPGLRRLVLSLPGSF